MNEIILIHNLHFRNILPIYHKFCFFLFAFILKTVSVTLYTHKELNPEGRGEISYPLVFGFPKL